MGNLPQTPSRGSEDVAVWRLGKWRPLDPASLRGDAGQGLVEYSLVMLLVVLLAIPALDAIGVSVTGFLSQAADKV